MDQAFELNIITIIIVGGPGHAHYALFHVVCCKQLAQASKQVSGRFIRQASFETYVSCVFCCHTVRSLGLLSSMAKKRCFEDFVGVSEIQVCKSAKIQGVVTSLSPIKSNKAGTTKYFEGEISDGKSCRRLVGFDAKLHSKLQEYHEKKEALALENCEIKQNRYGSELEVVVRSNSDLHLSPTKFDVAASAMSRDLGGEVTLAE